MFSQYSKIFSFHTGRKLIWFLSLLLTPGLIYFCNKAPHSEKYDENPYNEGQEQLKRNPWPIVPLPYEIPFIIQRTGADFKSNMINDFRKFNSYTTIVEKAVVNLGVYATDIGYLSAYGMTQKALIYMDSCLELNMKVCGQNVYNFYVLERFEKNLSKPDSLIQILNQFNLNNISFANKNDFHDYGTLMLVGAFIEALYITSEIINAYPKDIIPDNLRYQVLYPVISILLDQKKSLYDIIELLKNVDKKGGLELMTINELQKLYDIYENYPTNRNYSHPYSDRILSQLIEQISMIRTDIIS